jgi:hypothetical protein
MSGTYYVVAAARWALAGLFLAVVAGCSSSPTAPEISHDGLVLQDNTKFGLVYAKPGVEIGSYENFAVHHCEVAFRKNWQRDQNSSRGGTAHRVTDSDMEGIRNSLAELCETEFLSVLSVAPAYTIVPEDQADTETLLLRPNIINLDVAAPDIKSPGISRSYTTESGEMTLFLEVADASTGETLFRIVDRRRGLNAMRLQWSNSVTNGADAKRILNAWGQQFREGLDQVYRGDNG